MKIVRPASPQPLVVVGYRCDRCGRQASESADQREQFEAQEYVSIEFTAGYGTKAFVDGSTYSCELCQYCIRDLLDPYLRCQRSEYLPQLGLGRTRRQATIQRNPQL